MNFSKKLLKGFEDKYQIIAIDIIANGAKGNKVNQIKIIEINAIAKLSLLDNFLIADTSLPAMLASA